MFAVISIQAKDEDCKQRSRATIPMITMEHVLKKREREREREREEKKRKRKLHSDYHISLIISVTNQSSQIIHICKLGVMCLGSRFSMDRIFSWNAKIKERRFIMRAITETFLSKNIYSGIQYKCLNYIKKHFQWMNSLGYYFGQ